MDNYKRLLDSTIGSQAPDQIPLCPLKSTELYLVWVTEGWVRLARKERPYPLLLLLLEADGKVHWFSLCSFARVPVVSN